MWASAAGWVGTVVLLVSYALVSSGRIDGSRRRMHAVNAGGAIALGLASYQASAYSSATANIAWAGIAVASIARVEATRRRAPVSAGSAETADDAERVTV